MRKRRWDLRDRVLYLILDTEVYDYDKLFDIMNKAINAGVDIVQLRDKHGSCRDILRFSIRCVEAIAGRVPFIVNDRVDIAYASGADGVHLGQDDLPINIAREMLGENAIIGISAQSIEHAHYAENHGADYIGFGSVFKTLTKPDRKPMDLRLLSDVCKQINIPIFAIGGISLSNLSIILDLGVRRIAVCRAILEADHITDVVKDMKTMLSNQFI